MTAAGFDIAEDDKGLVLRLSGDWTALSLGRVPERLERKLGGREVHRVDLDDLGAFDTSGAHVLVQVSGGQINGRAFAARPEAGRLFAMVERLERDAAPPPRKADWLTRMMARVGRGALDVASELWLSLAFLGRLLVASGKTLGSPGNIRWPAWFSHMERAGLDALPIVAMTNFFVGAVIAFLAADILTQFGAAVFSVPLIGSSVLREFAVVITAVLLAGRSASSFAAEIGSMRMNQEIDAMQVMGVDPFQALVIPRLAALIVMLPLLTFIAMVSGLLGGMLVTWAKLDLGPAFFLTRLSSDAFMSQHFWVGMSKAPVFAIIIAGIGARQGMSVGGDVESLGRRVTAAVVQAIFAIIAIDAVFALVYLEVGL